MHDSGTTGKPRGIGLRAASDLPCRGDVDRDRDLRNTGDKKFRRTEGLKIL
jgi:hypothetical protein